MVPSEVRNYQEMYGKLEENVETFMIEKYKLVSKIEGILFVCKKCKRGIYSKNLIEILKNFSVALDECYIKINEETFNIFISDKFGKYALNEYSKYNIVSSYDIGKVVKVFMNLKTIILKFEMELDENDTSKEDKAVFEHTLALMTELTNIEVAFLEFMK